MMLIKRQKQRGQDKRGVTLIELLIVMAIVILLAGLTLPSVKNLLKDQRIGQAARVVQGFAESARARAIAMGRPVALILERSRTDAGGGVGLDGLIANDTCVRISLGEVFPPYEGDWAGTTARLFDKLDALGNAGSDGWVDLMEINAAQAASLTGSNPLVSAGDIVELGDRNQGLLVNSVTTGLSVTGSGMTVVKIIVENPPRSNARSLEPMWPLTTALDNGAEVRFRIYRKPSKMMAGSVVLPRGTCIDLSMSGSGPSGREFSTSSIAAPTNAKPVPGDYWPVSIVFGPRGTVEVAYYQGRTSNGNTFAVRTLPNGIFHLLIGRTDQVDPLYGTSDSQVTVSTRDNFKPNLTDPANVWISLNPYSGMIYSSQLMLSTAGDVLGARSMASNGVLRQGK